MNSLPTSLVSRSPSPHISRGRAAGLALSLLASTLGCQNSQKETSAPEPPPESSREALNASPSPPKNAPTEPPRQKQFEDTAEASLGTLPQGIGLRPGSRAPSLRGTTSDGKSLTLAELLTSRRVLLVFYRGGWCPYCNFQVRELTQRYPDFEKLGIEPVVVSVDQVSEAAKTNAAYTIPFPVVSDPELAWHEAFRVTTEVPQARVEAMKSKHDIDLEARSGKSHHTIAIPSIFLIEKDGKVSFAHADENYQTRPRAQSLLDALEKLP